MRQPPLVYGMPCCLSKCHIVSKLALMPKKKKKYLNSINNKNFILRLNKGLSELITCWETNSFQEVLILEESTELKL